MRSTVGYYWQSITATHSSCKPPGRWTNGSPSQAPTRPAHAPATGPAPRAFAVAELHLPDNASYRRYADLKRPAAVVERGGRAAGCPHAAHLVLSG